jgi:hypothetical protein
MTKVEAFRVDSKIVHIGIPVKENGHHVTGDLGQPLYRLKCQGRNVRFYATAAEDQDQRVTCQRCGKGQA